MLIRPPLEEQGKGAGPEGPSDACGFGQVGLDCSGLCSGEVQQESMHAPSALAFCQPLHAFSLDVRDGRSSSLCLDSLSDGEWPDQKRLSFHFGTVC